MPPHPSAYDEREAAALNDAERREAADEIERLQSIADTTAIMTEQAIKRLKAQLARTETALDNEFNNGIALCAEIERLQKDAQPLPPSSLRIVERLRDAASDLAVEAADEIERLKARPADELLLEENTLMRAALLSQADKIERMQAEIDQLSEQLAEATTEVEKLRELWENSPSAAR